MLKHKNISIIDSGNLHLDINQVVDDSDTVIICASGRNDHNNRYLQKCQKLGKFTIVLE
jgi:hypothetical protein